MEEAKHFIGNRWVAPAGDETIPVVDPSDGQVFAQLARGNAADIDRAVQAARARLRRRVGPRERRRPRAHARAPVDADRRVPRRDSRSSKPATPANR